MATTGTVPCDCCGQPAPRTRAAQEWGFCQTCRDAGCGSLGCVHCSKDLCEKCLAEGRCRESPSGKHEVEPE